MKNIIFTLLLISCVTASYAETSCKVNNPNIADSYVGECLDGFAHGQGVAKGRDEYRGSFFKGDIHGYGVYTWGDNTEWKSQRYDGWYLKGKRSGYGILSMNIDSEIYRKKIEYINKKFFPEIITISKYGVYEDNKVSYKGFFMDTSFIHQCNSQEECLESFIERNKNNFEASNIIFIANKKDFKEFIVKNMKENLEKSKADLINKDLSKKEEVKKEDKAIYECFYDKFGNAVTTFFSEGLDDLIKNSGDNEELFITEKFMSAFVDITKKETLNAHIKEKQSQVYLECVQRK